MTSRDRRMEEEYKEQEGEGQENRKEKRKEGRKKRDTEEYGKQMEGSRTESERKTRRLNGTASSLAAGPPPSSRGQQAKTGTHCWTVGDGRDGKSRIS